MTGFDAGNAVTSLDYDLSTVKVSDPAAAETLSTAKGTIPEPSQDVLDTFTHRLRQMALDPDMAAIVGLGTDAQPGEILAAVGDVGEDKLKGIADAMVDAVIDLCQGSPSEAEIRALPPRVRTAFAGWLSGELVGPTRPTSGTRPLPALANGAGPGT